MTVMSAPPGTSADVASSNMARDASGQALLQSLIVDGADLNSNPQTAGVVGGTGGLLIGSHSYIGSGNSKVDAQFGGGPFLAIYNGNGIMFASTLSLTTAMSFGGRTGGLPGAADASNNLHVQTNQSGTWSDVAVFEQSPNTTGYGVFFPGNVKFNGDFRISGASRLYYDGGASPTFTNINANLSTVALAGGGGSMHKITFNTNTTPPVAGTRLFTVTLPAAFNTALIVVLCNMSGATFTTGTYTAVPTGSGVYDVYATATLPASATGLAIGAHVMGY